MKKRNRLQEETCQGAEDAISLSDCVFIVVGAEHYNTLGVVRTLGERGGGGAIPPGLSQR